MEQKLLTLPEDLNSPRVILALVSSIVPLCWLSCLSCLSYDLKIYVRLFDIFDFIPVMSLRKVWGEFTFLEFKFFFKDS